MLFILLCNLVVWRESTEVNYKVVVICRMWSMLRVSKIPLVKSNFLDDVETTMSALYEQMLVKQSVEGTMTVSWRVQAVISFLQAVLSFSRCLRECTKMFYRFRFLFTSKCGEGVLVRSGQLIHLVDLSVCCNVSLPINLHVFAISLRKNAGKYETWSKRVSCSQALKWETAFVWSPWEARVFNQLTKKIDKNHLVPHKQYRVVLTLYGQWIKYRENVKLWITE